MNAGRGPSYNLQIGNHVESVDIYYDGEIKKLSSLECDFSYRKSIFQEMDKAVILGAVLRFPNVKADEELYAIERRLAEVKLSQDRSAPNFGTVFSVSNGKIMHALRKLHCGYKEGVSFSANTDNWMVNNGEGNYEQAIKMITFGKTLHRIFGKECKCEVRIIE